MHECKPFTQATVRCRIYQADFDQVMDLMFAKSLPENCRRDVPSEKYSLVFDDVIAAKDLEDIFRIFNVAHPNGYTGRSLTTTDVVEVDDGQEHEIYICESFGFAKANFDATAIRRTEQYLDGLPDDALIVTLDIHG